MAFRWRAFDGPLMVVLGSFLPSSNYKRKKKTTSKLDPLLQNFLDLCMFEQDALSCLVVIQPRKDLNMTEKLLTGVESINSNENPCKMVEEIGNCTVSEFNCSHSPKIAL